MNTTMAPLDKIRHSSLEDLEQRDSLTAHSLERRKGDGNDNEDGDNKGRRKDSSGGNGDGNGDGKGGGGGGGSDNNNDDGPEKDSKPGKKKSAAAESPFPTGLPVLPPPPPPEELRTTPAALSSTTIPVPKPAAASSSTPTTAIVITTTPLSTPSLPSSAPTTTLSLLSPSATLISSLFPTTVAPAGVPTLAPQISESLSAPQQPRKGEEPGDNGTKTKRPFTFTKPAGSTVTEMQTVMVTAQSALAAPTALPDLDPPKPDRNNDGDNNNNKNKGNKNKNKGDLSPTAERLLIAAGAIGAFIMIITIVYLVLIRKRIDPFGKVRRRKIRKGGNRGLYGWRRDSHASEAPPSYPGDEYGYPVEKKDPRYDPSYPPMIKPVTLPPLAIPEFPETTVNNTVTRGDSPNQAQAAAPFGGYSPHESPISDPPASYNNTGRQNTFLSRQPSDATTSYGLTQSSMLTQQTTNLQPTNQELNHMSYMSSISSGFGDGLIIPDPANPNAPMQGYRQSRAPGTFSWMQPTGQQKGDRDTVYTTTSEESAPRFRTVNSWVAQQADRVDGTRTVDSNAPKVPAIPQTHQRNISEDPVFKYHPGDEVQISRGSRVPSEILDRKTGIDK